MQAYLTKKKSPNKHSLIIISPNYRQIVIEIASPLENIQFDGILMISQC